MENKFKRGDKVHYVTDHAAPQNGIVKKVSPDGYTAFVVYKCNDDWDNFRDYTAEGTLVRSLVPGWLDDTGQLIPGSEVRVEKPTHVPERAEGGRFKGDGSVTRARKEASLRRKALLAAKADAAIKEQVEQSPVSSGPVKVMLEVVAGIIPGTPMPEHTKQFALTREMWEDPTTVMRIYGYAQEYMRNLWNPAFVNWVRLEWIYF